MGNVLHIGIDPGATGAVAVLDADAQVVKFYDTPVMNIKVGKKFKNVLDAFEMVRILKYATAGRTVMVSIEKVNAMPDVGSGARMGATSAFSFGMGFGLWLGILAALELPHQQVHPATWKSVCMSGMSKEKDASRLRAMQLYPQSAGELARKKDHARGDALLIARWGWITYGGQPAKPQGESLFE